MNLFILLFFVLSQSAFAGPAVVSITKSAATSLPQSSDVTTSVKSIKMINSSEPTITYQIAETIFEENKLSTIAVLQIQNKKFELKSVSHGLRKKKVFGLVPVRIYTVEFFVSQPAKLVKSDEGILSSLRLAESVLLKLTLQRDLSGKKITDSFKESLELNGVDIANPSKEISAVLSELASINEFKKGETFSLAATWNNDTATLYIQKTDGTVKTFTGPEKFITELFSIWFGKTTDDRLADLKKTLLKQ